MLKKQDFIPQKNAVRQAIRISEYAAGLPAYAGRNRNGRMPRACAGEHFIITIDDCVARDEPVFYSTQENYIKFHIRLAGQNRIVFNEVGEYEIDQPQLFIVSCPEDMVKIDLPKQGVRNAAVNIIVSRDFFVQNMGMDHEALPGPLRGMVRPIRTGFACHAYPLGPELVAATRTLLSASAELELSPAYYQARAVELLCLIVNDLTHHSQTDTTEKPLTPRTVVCLQAAYDLIQRHYAGPMTLTTLSREVGLSKTALTVGFQQLYGLSVFDYIRQVRMHHAYRLLLAREQSITDIAHAVGYKHTCNFSTAFRGYFGCAPKAISIRRH